MRITTNINKQWCIIKNAETIEDAYSLNGQPVDIPHTWNKLDGQNGGDNYFRGICYYKKKLEMPEVRKDDKVFLEFRGVNSSAQVYFNRKMLTLHEGGYSTFRTEITELLSDENEIVVSVDNSPNDRVYPQMADFTFYGGIYRDVFLIIVPESHFTLDYYGGDGIMITPVVNGPEADVRIKTFATGSYDNIRIIIEGVGVAYGNDVLMRIHEVRLWQGRKDPYLYTAKAELIKNGQVIDAVSAQFGCRTFHIDPERGFFLNGESYPLRGVSRHQDWEGVGNALTREMQNKDMELIKEIGANTVRLAHYQHDQYFYDLCDRNGMIVWAEIPYITKHMDKGRENTLTQMKELIIQNYNHPSIVFWGLSNEITAAGVKDEIVDNNKELHSLCHEYDSERLTVMANVFMLDKENPILGIPDVIAYNHYFGWYIGELEDNDTWFDDFHANFPNRAIGLSEYGAEGILKWQTANPEKGDYTEQYQAVYHEHMMKMIWDRPFIWGSYVWNMFDFAADARDEGGVKGRNNKGLVTFDRKIKKDSFYLHKAYLSDEPFVHICGRRYIDRAEEISEVKVYSNQPNVTLYQNDNLIGKKEGERIFLFSIKLEKENIVVAKSGALTDSILIKQVDEANSGYVFSDKSKVANWLEELDLQYPEGYYSIKDKVEDLIKTERGDKIVKLVMELGDSAKKGMEAEVEISEEMQFMIIKSLSLEFLMNKAKLDGAKVKAINDDLNKISKVS